MELFIFAILLILGVILLVIGTVKNNTLTTAFSGVIISWAFYSLIEYKEKRNYPTAIDVYRGKTTLQITYRDSIPVDTVVVFKK